MITAYRYLAGVCVRGHCRAPLKDNMVACLRSRSWLETAFPRGYAEVFAGECDCVPDLLSASLLPHGLRAEALEALHTETSLNKYAQ